MTDKIEARDEPKDSLWPTRILWTGVGSVCITAIISVSMVLSQWRVDLAGDMTDAIQMVTAVGLLASAVWAGSVGVQTMRASQASSEAAVKANDQAAVDSINANRPYVGVSIEPGINGDGAYDLLVKNYGRSIAQNLTIAIHDAPKPADTIVVSLIEMFETPRSLMPTQTIRAIWQLNAGEKATFVPDGDPDAENGTHRKKVAGMGRSAVLTASYSDADGRDYKDKFEVMLDRSGLWPAPNVGPDISGRELRHADFYKLGQTIATHIGSTRY